MQKRLTMDMHAALEVAKKLRTLVRKADQDAENWSSSDILVELIAMADDYQDLAEAIEMEIIIQSQKDWVEAN
jgi:chemotaxis regulatin CheY-phosphate phosphatase CheZ